MKARAKQRQWEKLKKMFPVGRIEKVYEADALIIYGASNANNSTRDIYFTHDRLADDFTLHGYDGERPVAIRNLTPQELRKIIGAAIHTLEVMESERDNSDVIAAFQASMRRLLEGKPDES